MNECVVMPPNFSSSSSSLWFFVFFLVDDVSFQLIWWMDEFLKGFLFCQLSFNLKKKISFFTRFRWLICWYFIQPQLGSV